MKFKLSLLLLSITTGCALLFAVSVWFRYRPIPVPTKQSPARSRLTFPVNQEELHYVLSIPDLKIYLPIFEGDLKLGTWSVSPSGVIHFPQSPVPGHIGNSIIYGHNWPNLLGPLHQASVGQNIYIQTEQSTAIFTISNIAKVSPSQPDLLASSTDRRLTLYTCTGFLDSQRLVVTAIKSDL